MLLNDWPQIIFGEQVSLLALGKGQFLPFKRKYPEASPISSFWSTLAGKFRTPASYWLSLSRQIEGNTKNQIGRSRKICVPAKRSMYIAIGRKCKWPECETSFECGQRGVSLCVVPCFSVYHTQKHLEVGYKVWKKASE